MKLLVKNARFVSRTEDSFTIDCDGRIGIFRKSEMMKKENGVSIGGMWTKLEAAWMATQAGIPVVIARG